jgi:hypothetical protein
LSTATVLGFGSGESKVRIHQLKIISNNRDEAQEVLGFLYGLKVQYVRNAAVHLGYGT